MNTITVAIYVAAGKQTQETKTEHFERSFANATIPING